MANGARWSIALLVLVVAGIIAIWPRGGADSSGDVSPPTVSATVAPRKTTPNWRRSGKVSRQACADSRSGDGPA